MLGNYCRGLWFLLIGLGASSAFAGVFSTSHFVTPGEFAIGLEPEFVTTGSAALDINLRYTHGMNELSNLTGIIGTGGGNRLFRAGANYTFDFYPDMEKQPGIGLALQGLFVQLPNAGSFELTAFPYIHKVFLVSETHIEPFVAVPVGVTLSQGQYNVLTTLVGGTLFEHNEHFRTVVELGVNLNNAYTYVSGGFVYYH